MSDLELTSMSQADLEAYASLARGQKVFLDTVRADTAEDRYQMARGIFLAGFGKNDLPHPRDFLYERRQGNAATTDDEQGE